jgi:DNA-binding transcriptional ArsR family regulator
MPRKKQAESAKSRRQKLLDYFHSHPRQARFISDVKDDLSIKNEQNLRRDLELLAEDGALEKTKDTSKLPARAVFTLKAGAPHTLKSKSDANEDSFEAHESDDSNESQAEAQSAPSQEAKSGDSDLKGRRSARELEQRILSLLEQEPTTVKDLAEHLKRQQPTVTKALERMQERRLVERKRQGRSFVYSRLSSRAAAPAAPAAAVSAPIEASQVASAPAVETVHSGYQNQQGSSSLQSMIEAAVKAGVSAGVNAALEHILAKGR